MTGKDNRSVHTDDLPQWAEVQAREKRCTPEHIARMTPEEISKCYRELRARQIQLEMENEELRQARTHLDIARARFFDLYERAPLGYLTVSENGLIQEINQTAVALLGVGRETILKQPLARFIFADDLDTYTHNQQQSFRTGEAGVLELRLVKSDGTILWVRLVVSILHQIDDRCVSLVVISDIHEHKLCAMALQESEERYRLLFEAASDALFLIAADTGQILQGNRRVSELYGYDLDEIRGKVITDFSAEPEKIEELMRDTLARPDKTLGVRLRQHRKKDGSTFSVEITGRTFPLQGSTQLLLAVRDVSERSVAEEALRVNGQRRLQDQQIANDRLKEQAVNLASIYQALDSVGVIVGDLEGDDARIRIFNSGAVQMFGYQPDAAIDKSIALIYPPELVEIIPERVRRLRTGQPILSFNMPLVRQSGERFPVAVSLHPFDNDEGRYKKVVGIFRDISELMQVQQQMEAINEDLERRVDARTLELQETQNKYLHAEKLSAIGKLSASIAHEFNNPLQGILSILKGLKKRAILEEEDRDLLNAAIGEGDRIKELIRSLQEFNRPSSGQKTLMDIHKSLYSLFLLYKSEFKSKRIVLELDLAEHLPPIVAVSDQIKQVFLNLLTNAVDACKQPCGVITVSTWLENEYVAVAIKDTGAGIKAEDMDLVFQPFYSTKATVKGTGLGLSVSHGIVKHHGGQIRVESHPGQGATFTVLLPVKGADNVAAA